ncbi:MAG: 1-deoxy-D-xylulose-5-phosphate synthase [Clostridiales bacterium]|nr:1-deoxy-D-xylulose-5-phosphate synthase [Clostridiales bacterium]
MTIEQKEQLAVRLRNYVIKYTAKNGGHLSSNLGVVELTIALLSTYDFPTDSVIFDVGHQCYSWKILTGRSEEFKKLRQEGGLSGFPKTAESEYDSFNTGHSSTSMSAACGLVRARKLRQESGKVVVIIGDGALSGGMAYGAMNDICQCGDDIVVILNDNQMSIDQVVGGFAKHLERLRLAPGYLTLTSRWQTGLQRVPLIENLRVKGTESLKRAGRRIIHNYHGTSSMFEQLGFRYYGPVDGHDICQLERYLRSARAIKGPVLVHTITQKGRGYSYAEQKPSEYHGVVPFEIEVGLNGYPETESQVSWSEVFGQTITKLGKSNPDVCAISAAMTSGTGLLEFEAQFPDRFFDVGIAEQHALTLAAGLAKGGMRPFVALYSTFLQRGLDQLLHDICLQNLPVTIVVDRAGAVGGDGETHQGIYDLSLTMPFPNLEIFAPATANDLRSLLRIALDRNNPVLIRYPKDLAFDLAEIDRQSRAADKFDPYCIRQVRAGKDMVVLALGPMVFPALAAADCLRGKGISISVYSSICVNSCNIHDIISIIKDTKRLLVIEDGIKKSGWGESIISQLCSSVDGLISEHLGIIHPLAGQAKRSSLLSASGLDMQGIIKAVESLIIHK